MHRAGSILDCSFSPILLPPWIFIWVVKWSFKVSAHRCSFSFPPLRVLAYPAVLLRDIFHHPADSQRGPGRETVQGQVWAGVGHILSACPLQDLPLHLLKRGEGWQVDAGPKLLHRHQAIASKNTLSQLHGAHVRAGATFASVQEDHSLDSASEARLQTACCESLESFSGAVWPQNLTKAFWYKRLKL